MAGGWLWEIVGIEIFRSAPFEVQGKQDDNFLGMDGEGLVSGAFSWRTASAGGPYKAGITQERSPFDFTQGKPFAPQGKQE